MAPIVVPHRPEWRGQFEREAFNIKQALGANVLAIHHIGSTAIPNILAKPIIDILIEACSLTKIDQANSALIDLGYEVMGEFGIKNRRYFRKDNPQGIRTHHIHIFETGSSELVRHLAFRDYLRKYPKIAKEYSDLKASLTNNANIDLDTYINGKNPFIQATEIKAVEWYKSSA